MGGEKTRDNDPTKSQIPFVEDYLMDRMALLLVNIWRRRRVVGVSILCAVVLAFLGSLLLPSRYEARALLVISPPAISPESSSDRLSSDGLGLVVDSDLIKQEARKELIAGGNDKSAVERLEFSNSSPRRSTNDTSRLIVALQARADDPELAAAGANLYARQVQAAVAPLMGLAEAAFLIDEYPRSAQDLKSKEEALSLLQNKLGHETLELDSRLQREMLAFQMETQKKILEHEKKTVQREHDLSVETDRLTRTYEAETERMTQQLLATRQPERSERELAAKLDRFIDLSSQLAATSLQMKTLADRLTELGTELNSQPLHLLVSKAITDDALWNRISQAAQGLPDSLGEKKLSSEVLNPVRQELERDRSEARVERETLNPLRQHLAEELTELRSEMAELAETVANNETARVELTKQREAGLQALHADRDSLLKELKLERQADLEILRQQRETAGRLLQKEHDSRLEEHKRASELQLTQERREVGSAEDVFGELSKDYGRARITQEISSQGVLTGVKAAPPTQPVSPRILLNVVAAGLLGFFLSIAFVVVQGRVEKLEGRR